MLRTRKNHMIITRHHATGALLPAAVAESWPDHQHVGKTGRIISTAAGAALLLKGLLMLEDRPFRSLLRLAAGGYLLYRGFTGRCVISARIDETVDKAENLAENTFA